MIKPYWEIFVDTGAIRPTVIELDIHSNVAVMDVFEKQLKAHPTANITVRGNGRVRLSYQGGLPHSDNKYEVLHPIEVGEKLSSEYLIEQHIFDHYETAGLDGDTIVYKSDTMINPKEGKATPGIVQRCE